MGISHTQEEGGESPLESQQEYFCLFLFPSSESPLASSLFLAVFFLPSDTLCGKLKPQTTTLRNSKWILSARPTPPSLPLLSAHALDSDSGLGSVTGVGVCNPQRGWLQFQLLLSFSGSQRERKSPKNRKSGLLASFGSGRALLSLTLSSGWEAGSGSGSSWLIVSRAAPLLSGLLFAPWEAPSEAAADRGLGDSPVPFSTSGSNAVLLAVNHIRLSPFPSFCHT